MSMSEPESIDIIHRLKNHLAIIVGYCDLLIPEFEEGDRRRADFLEVHKAGQEAMALIPELARRIRDGGRAVRNG
jgi:hypothetical protein